MKLFFEKHLILHVKTKASLRKLLDIKNKGCKCYLGKKEQKSMFLVLSQPGMQFGFEHPQRKKEICPPLVIKEPSI